MPDQRTIWKRRIIAMAAVGLIVAIPVTIAARGGDEPADEGQPAAESGLPPVGKLQLDRRLGIELRVPEGWTRRREGAAVAFHSKDDTVLIAISAPGPAADTRAIQSAAVDSIESRYRRVELVDRFPKQRLGKRPAQTAAIAAQHPKSGAPLRILVSTAKGDKKAYLVEVFASGSNPNAALLEAQVLLNNLRLEG